MGALATSVCRRLLVVGAVAHLVVGAAGAVESTTVAPYIVDELRSALKTMDHDGDGIVSGLEMAVGILSSAEPWPLASAAYLRRRSSPFERYPFGEKQCVDPTLDAVSFLECGVHRHRSTGHSEATEPAMGFEELFALHVRACTTPAAAWLKGLCLGTCTQCATPAPRDQLPVMAPSPPLGADAVTILISSDSHVEPWYLSPSAPPLNPSDGATTAT